MSKIDIIILAFLLFCAWLGYNRGIVRMGMALTGIVLSVLLMYYKWSEMLLFFHSWNIRNPYVLLLFMLGIIALITAFFVWISEWIERFFKLIFLNWVNKLAGMFLAVVVGVLMLSLLMIVATLVPQNKPMLSKAKLQNSAFAYVVFTIEQHTPWRLLVLKNFDQIKERVTEGSTENRKP